MKKFKNLSKWQKKLKTERRQSTKETSIKDFNISLPYNIVSQRRYQDTRKTYNEQLLYELQQQEAMQPNAQSAIRFHRCFAITTLWPPLHTRAEIDMVISKMRQFSLSDEQEKRLRHILQCQDLNKL